MKALNKDLLISSHKFPEDLKVGSVKYLPERVLQFGEGVFLRGFVDWMLDCMNEKGIFNGRAVVVQPRGQEAIEVLNSQNGLYTLYLRGIRDGKTIEEKSVVSSISRGINLHRDFDEYLRCAENPDLRFVVSNTTEAGIAYNPADRPDDRPPASFPGKLAVFLYRRYTAFRGNPSKGMVILPCELIERNGDRLKEIVLRLAGEWGLEGAFIDWIENSNHFLNTLVDRIVTGYPAEEAEKLTGELGYGDRLLNAAELFHLWVIEGSGQISAELPFDRAGLDVVWTDDLTPYRTRKVRILNGAHTMTALAAYLYGKNTVGECIDDELVHAFMNEGIFQEIIPTLDMPEKELADFAEAVLERFANPFIRHNLLSIAMNSTSKFKTRVLPSIFAYMDRKGEIPEALTFSLAALIAFYRGAEIRENALIGKREGAEYNISDDMQVLQMFLELWSSFDGSREGAERLAAEVLSRADIWGSDLNELKGFGAKVSEYLFRIVTGGMKETMGSEFGRQGKRNRYGKE